MAAESFFATLECELVDRSRWRTHAKARTAVFDVIEAFDNRRRRHSALGCLSPAQFEARRCPPQTTAAYPYTVHGTLATPRPVLDGDAHDRAALRRGGRATQGGRLARRGDPAVEHTLTRLSGEAAKREGWTWKLTPPKTESSRRRVPLNATAIAALRQQKVRQLEARVLAGPDWEDHGLVFTSLRDQPLREAHALAELKQVLVNAKLPDMRLHDPAPPVRDAAPRGDAEPAGGPGAARPRPDRDHDGHLHRAGAAGATGCDGERRRAGQKADDA